MNVHKRAKSPNKLTRYEKQAEIGAPPPILKVISIRCGEILFKQALTSHFNPKTAGNIICGEYGNDHSGSNTLNSSISI